MHNIALLVSYEGTTYYGWQKTIAGPNIENTLQSACEQLLQQPIILQAASRTDRGVHASGQCVNFFCNKPNLDCSKILLGLNALLPPCIRILDVSVKHETFHPTIDCTAKEYHYQICLGKVQRPQHRLFSWHCPYELDFERMNVAAKSLEGEHDFSAFCNGQKNTHYAHYRRHINEIDIQIAQENRCLIRVKGNHFLYKMVRNIVGTLVMVGRKKMIAEEIGQLLQSKDRRLIGQTAPACGLTLFKVYY
ncbi:MAG: tRNA pseudouridine(38-40) synthase TruA [Parachlamydiales bacterium]|nr:tRNA pseudouridine(38-40) synthase TruA [Parachlamydiales bacterium]